MANLKDTNIIGTLTVNGGGVITVDSVYESGTSGYFILNIGNKKYMRTWQRINQSFSDNSLQTFTLPNSISYNNINWCINVSANGYTDCAWLNSDIVSNNQFTLRSQRYSNGSNTLEVFVTTHGWVSTNDIPARP